MKAPEGTRKNHMNEGPHRSLAAQHERTRLPDPENISGDGRVETHEPLKRLHENRGGSRTDGLAARHHTTRLPDAEDLHTEIMDVG
jgi:hypothetical protein